MLKKLETIEIEVCDFLTLPHITTREEVLAHVCLDLLEHVQQLYHITDNKQDKKVDRGWSVPYENIYT